MAAFEKRTIERFKTLGERLAKVREEAGHSISDVMQATGISAEYIQAIEQGRYTALPGSVYIESYLKRYAEFLHVDPQYVLDLYRQGEQRVIRRNQQERFTPKPQQLPKEILTPRRIARIAIGTVVVGALAYLAFIVVQVFSPPQLVVSSPPDNARIDQSQVDVTGYAEPETTVTINGREVFLDSDGNFSETVTLSEGINTITITSQKTRSRPTEVVRTVLRE